MWDSFISHAHVHVELLDVKIIFYAIFMGDAIEQSCTCWGDSKMHQNFVCLVTAIVIVQGTALSASSHSVKERFPSCRLKTDHSKGGLWWETAGNNESVLQLKCECLEFAVQVVDNSLQALFKDCKKIYKTFCKLNEISKCTQVAAAQLNQKIASAMQC